MGDIQAGWEWEIAYWRLNSIEKTWLPWRIRRHWWPLAYLGDDEYRRRTLVIGPICFPLWRCRCKYCKFDIAELGRIVDGG